MRDLCLRLCVTLRHGRKEGRAGLLVLRLRDVPNAPRRRRWRRRRRQRRLEANDAAGPAPRKAFVGSRSRRRLAVSRNRKQKHVPAGGVSSFELPMTITRQPLMLADDKGNQSRVSGIIPGIALRSRARRHALLGQHQRCRRLSPLAGYPLPTVWWRWNS